jgi:AhpC/TSA family
MLALPALPGQEKAKDEKKDSAVKDKDEKKPPSPKEQYDALVSEFGKQQLEIRAEYGKAKGEEQAKLANKFRGLGKEFAEKFYKLAEDNPKDAAATDALFWIVQNGAGSEVYQKAADKVTALVAEMPLTELSKRLNTLRGASPAILDAVNKRTEKEEKDPAVVDLLVWTATNAYYLPAGQKAVERLVEKFPDHPSIERVCPMLGQGGVPKGDEMLKIILEKNDKRRVKAAAALELGRALAAKTDKLADDPAQADKVAAEGEKYLLMVIDQFAKDVPVPKKGAAPPKTDAERELVTLASHRKSAEQELKALRTLRVGKEAPEIKAPDLDGKEFKLSDYRGKVVMLDFWGHW